MVTHRVLERLIASGYQALTDAEKAEGLDAAIEAARSAAGKAVKLRFPGKGQGAR